MLSLQVVNFYPNVGTGLLLPALAAVFVGGTSVYETSSLQRHFRDVHVASQHMMVSESVMEVTGRILLGLDDQGFGI